MRMKKITFIIFLLCFILLNTSLIIANSNTKNNIDEYFRIHVVANSDNIHDQILKLHISENVQEYITLLTKDIKTKNECINCISNNIYNILKIAQNTIIQNGYNYNVAAYIGNIKYDDKTKDDIYMKAGIYNSLKIVIGDGKGENWWSLLFPHSIDGIEINDAINSNNMEYSFGIISMFDKFINMFKPD